MNKLKPAAIIAVAVLGSGLSSAATSPSFVQAAAHSHASHARHLSSCGTLRRPGNYLLTKDLGPVHGDCFDIHAARVTLDLGGHTLTGDGSGIGAGVRIFRRASRARVMNGQVGAFGTGVEDDAPRALLTRLGPRNNLGIGIYLNRVHGSVVERIYPWKNARFGIYLQRTARSRVLRNNVGMSGIYGIWLEASSHNTIVHNEVNASGTAGIYLGCSNAGISKEPCFPTDAHNQIGRNLVQQSRGDGIALDLGTRHNDVFLNRVVGSAGYDLYDANPGCGSNRWHGDVYTTHNQACVT